MSSSNQSFLPPKPIDLPRRKREKPQLSCTLCRKRKLKCDRAKPCDTCIKRGLSLSCTYVQSKQSSKTLPNPPQSSTHTTLLDRISQIEKLVAFRLNSVAGGGEENNIYKHPSFIQSQANYGQEERAVDTNNTDKRPSHIQNQTNLEEQTGVCETGNTEKRLPHTKIQAMQQSPTSSSDKGRISVRQKETTWVESDHWSAILDGISELRDSLDTENAEDIRVDISDVPGPDLLLGGRQQILEHEIIAALPSRPVADRLVAQFIKSVEFAPMVIHIPTFLSEYEYFWNYPAQTPIMWIGLLFGILCLASIHQQSGFEPLTESAQASQTQESADAGRLAQRYRAKIAQCLVLGNYTKPARYCIETLLLYMHVEHVRSQDAQTGLWILLGITIRLALRMGYHRDGADFYPKISPFHAEIHRRVWCVIVMMDCGASAQFGLPRMIQTRQCNTKPPRNLLDDDLREEIGELPPAKPDSVPTTVQYFVVKNRFIVEFGHIAELKTLTKPPEYIEILRIDGNLQSIYDGVPPSLIIRPMSQTILDSPSLITHRVYVALLFLRSKCTLHQMYLIPSWTNQIYKYSRTACIEAALEILSIQQTLDQETQLGGRLYEDRGKVSSVVRNDFLVATTILCVDANHELTKSSTANSGTENYDFGMNNKVIEALRNAHKTWLRSRNSSKEAQQAARAIEIVLSKVTPETSDSSTVEWDGTTLGSASDTNDNQTFDQILMTFNPTLHAGLQSDNGDFPDFSGLDLEMGDPGEYELPSATKGLETAGDDQGELGWMLSNDGFDEEREGY